MPFILFSRFCRLFLSLYIFVVVGGFRGDDVEGDSLLAGGRGETEGVTAQKPKSRSLSAPQITINGDVAVWS